MNLHEFQAKELLFKNDVQIQKGYMVSNLDKVEKIVTELSKESSTNKVTLIGHSSGGMILRLYLSDLLFSRKIYNGKDYANCLITLGSPNQAKRATYLRNFVSSKLPGSFYSADVSYISVAGELDLNGPIATKTSVKLSKSSYRSLNGNGDVIGDGLVPRDSALLIGSKQAVSYTHLTLPTKA